MDNGGRERGVSTVIGATLLFGFLIVLLATYQAQVVPIQNEQAEFQHSQEVQADMLELRNAILEADADGRTTFAEVSLGTRYQSRILAVNPPPASGALRTGDPQPITIRNESGAPITGVCPGGSQIESRILTYTPGYNEYDEYPTIVYENTVTYLNFSGRHVLLTDERLINGDTVNVNPVNTTFQQSGVRTVSVEPRPGLTNTREITDGSVTFPTQLTEDEWEQLLAEDLDPSNVTVSNGNLTIQTTGDVEVTCGSIGLNEVPPGGERGASGAEINPAGPNDIQVRGFDRPSNDVVEVTFNNTGRSAANITEARVSFYNNPSDTGGDIGPLELYDQNGTKVADLPILGENQPLDPNIKLPANSSVTVQFTNPSGEKFSQDDFFIIQFVFDNGRVGTYFIDVPA